VYVAGGALTTEHGFVRRRSHVAALALLASLPLLVSTATAGPQAPFTGSPFSIPGLIEAEDFDTGGEGVAYHDMVSGNAGGRYRFDTDVDIIARGTLSLTTGPHVLRIHVDQEYADVALKDSA
jgi:hypothetical protein